MKTVSTYASWYCGGLILFAFCLFAVACPSRELLLAIAFEVSVFAVLIAWRNTGWKRRQTKEREELLSLYAHKWRLFGKAKSLTELSISSLWLSASVVLTVECIGLTGAFFNIDRGFTRWFYNTVRWSEVIGLHPACTLELLAGAFSQAGNFVEAERLYLDILSVRKHLYGDRHIMRASIYADLGNLFQKQGKFKQAESAYRQALVTWNQEQWSGSVVNRLGNSLRSQGKFADAEAAYQKALAIRERQFGRNNYRIAETLSCYAALLQDRHRNDEAEQLLRRSQLILVSSSPESTNLNWLYVLCGFAITSGASFMLFSKKGIVRRLVSDEELGKTQNDLGKTSKDLMAPVMVLLAAQDCLCDCV